jgi:hypothetical protein
MQPHLAPLDAQVAEVQLVLLLQLAFEAVEVAKHCARQHGVRVAAQALDGLVMVLVVKVTVDLWQLPHLPRTRASL